MQGSICYDKCVRGYWLVNFPQYGEKDEIATTSTPETDMKPIPRMDARVNEKIREQFGESFFVKRGAHRSGCAPLLFVVRNGCAICTRKDDAQDEGRMAQIVMICIATEK